MSKTVVIGWDGMPPELAFDYWLEKLPNIKRMKEQGVWGSLESVIPYVTGPAWAAFATGTNPGKTGIFDFVMPQEKLSNLRPINSRDIKSKTVYEILEDNNKKSILVNLPVSHPPKTDNITITCFLTLGDNYVYPRKIKEEIEELKDYQIMPRPEYMESGNAEKLAEECRRVEKKRFEVSKRLFQEKSWDFFFCLFGSSDHIQHKAHSRMMKGHFNDDSEVVKLFKEMDRYLGWFIDNLPPDTQLIIMSDHGFKAYKGSFAINKYFLDKGLLVTRIKEDKLSITRSQKARTELLNKKGIVLNMPRLQRFVYDTPFVYNIACKVGKVIKKFRPLKLKSGIAVDLEASKVCCIPGGFQSIYINSRQRFENGLVEDEEYFKLKDELAEELRDLKDPKGEPLFAEVYKKEDIFTGPLVKDAPDFYVKHNKYLLNQQHFGKLFLDAELQGHGHYGIFAAIGPGIKKGEKIDARIIDIAPTILKITGLPVEPDMDGRVLDEIFS